MQSLDYAELQVQLDGVVEAVELAELDGLLVGLLIRGPSVDVKDLFTTLSQYLQDDESRQFDALQMQRLATLVATLAEHAQLLHQQDCWDWMPLQPNDSQGLGWQLNALAGWCAGFTYGLGLALAGDDELADDCRELIADMSEIARLDSSDISDDEAEANYAELLEYCRTAAYTLVTEFAPKSGDASKAHATH